VSSDTATQTDVLLVSGDLFLGSRIRAAAEAQNRSLDVAGSGRVALERLDSASYRLVLVDLETPGLQVGELLAARGDDNRPRMIAYGPHVHEQRLEAARQAGCDQVLTRGKFDATLPQLFQQYLTQPDT
jgi:CheY-like chemotaxis protein